MALRSIDCLEASERVRMLLDPTEKREGDRAREGGESMSEQEWACRRKGVQGRCAGGVGTTAFLRLSVEALAFNLRRRPEGAVRDDREVEKGNG